MNAACKRLGLSPPTSGQHKLFTSTAAGLGVRLPGWSYPVVFDLTTGHVAFDNYNGRWGEQSKLDALLQLYAVEKARLEARKKGYTATEQTLADGSIKLTIQVNGGVA